ncbi:MAG: preprotein translocase subunit YajC [Planctomycetales bacterium]|nr:preprotein translocase subunit YajC [Planctomycetales bacterium]NIM07747.1 preprotein translocase subunit YajC [Planctomycetales bacterium]NIN07246.1 preprotein translocase subunit YajC [Planctomycetales bacterium]NIO33549.1 preprotein translocase subunit YajC [Planctomycetales bacterium]NIO45364.1 preprotein translocase subunit YajC [Planctomycetales bacterium]
MGSGWLIEWLMVDWFLVAQGEDAGIRQLVGLVFPMLAIGLLFYLMLIRPERQKQSTHQQLLANLKKNDRVVTVGGIKGIVSNVQRSADEVTINVDESTGTRIRVTLASIARVEPGEAKASGKSK